MKMIKIYISFLILFFAQNVFAQIDTSVYYPLHVGDKWEYYGRFIGYHIVEVVVEKTMPNGKTYFMLNNITSNWKYQRVENNRYVMIYNENAVGSEFMRYDLLGEKGNIWKFFTDEYIYGIFEMGKDSDNLLNQNLEWREYREVYVDTTKNPIDTLWSNGVDLYWPRITNGLGVTTYANELAELIGIRINGVGYGSLVSVDENPEIVNEFELYQNYPNPFNPNTRIKYSLPHDSHIIINVFNTLGEKVKILFEGYKKRGEHAAYFDGSDLTSGAYFIQLVGSTKQKTIKALLLK